MSTLFFQRFTPRTIARALWGAGAALTTICIAGAFVAPAAYPPGRVSVIHAIDAQHLRLLRSEPEPNDTLRASPKALRLWFSEAPEMAVTTIGLSRSGTGSAAGAVPLERPTRGPAADAPVVVSLRAAAQPGAYTVTWRTTARDGHPAKGSFQFAVAAPATGR